MIAAAQVQHLRKRWKEMEPVLNEQSRRRWAATEAKALGRGGISCVVRVTGLARRTVYRGLDDIRRRHKTGLGRIRKRGGGRKPKIVHDPTLLKDLKTLVEPATRGDPMKSLLWTSRSLRKLSKELANKGHEVSHTVAGELLQKAGYSLQANRKTREGNQHMDQDARRILPERRPAGCFGGHQKEGIGGQFQECGSRMAAPGQPPKTSMFMT